MLVTIINNEYRYVDMYGPGMVVYWFGFVEGLNLPVIHRHHHHHHHDHSNNHNHNDDDDDDDEDREGWPCIEEVLVVSSVPPDMRVS